MEAETYAALRCDAPGGAIGVGRDIAAIELLQLVPAHRMRAQRKDLAVDPERADSELAAPLDRMRERHRVRHRDVTEISPTGIARQRRDVLVRRVAEAWRRVAEGAAESPSD